MNRRPIGNASKNAVIAFGFFFGQMDMPAKTTGRNLHFLIGYFKTYQFMELLLKFKPVSSLKCRKAQYSLQILLST